MTVIEALAPPLTKREHCHEHEVDGPHPAMGHKREEPGGEKGQGKENGGRRMREAEKAHQAYFTPLMVGIPTTGVPGPGPLDWLHDGKGPARIFCDSSQSCAAKRSDLTGLRTRLDSKERGTIQTLAGTRENNRRHDRPDSARSTRPGSGTMPRIPRVRLGTARGMTAREGIEQERAGYKETLQRPVGRRLSLVAGRG